MALYSIVDGSNYGAGAGCREADGSFALAIWSASISACASGGKGCGCSRRSTCFLRTSRCGCVKTACREPFERSLRHYQLEHPGALCLRAKERRWAASVGSGADGALRAELGLTCLEKLKVEENPGGEESGYPPHILHR